MTLERHATRAALVATLLLPPLLIHARAAAEGVFAALALGILLRCALRRDAAPFRAPWLLAALAYWAWLMLCTLLAGGGAERIAEAFVWVRLPLAVVALSGWVLVDAEARRWLLWSTGLAMLWVAMEAWAQLILGRGILGRPRGPSGELTGPFTRPRAGPFLVRGMWPPLLALLGAWLRADAAHRVAAWGLVAACLATLVFIGQRIPLVFGLFGLGVAALLLPALRGPAMLGGAVGAAALAASPVLAPAAFQRLVVQFGDQLIRFPDSPYGLILARGLEMARQHPWTGLGYMAFRHHCADPAYHVGWDAGSDGGGEASCVLHAHNAYLEALTDAGWPGFVLFTLAAGLWIAAAGQGLRRRPEPVRVGLFLGVLIPLVPLSSGSAFTSLPTAGVWMLMTGWAIAAAREAEQQHLADANRSAPALNSSAHAR